MKVIYKPTGQLGVIPDDKFDPNLFDLADTPEPSSNEPVASSPNDLFKQRMTGQQQVVPPKQTEQFTPQNAFKETQPKQESTKKVGNPYGLSLEEISKAKISAQSAGDTDYVKFYDSLLNSEQEYQSLIGANGGEKVEPEANLRKEFRTALGDIDFQSMRSAYDKISNTTKTAAGDLSMIFAYMKLLDPGSTVRESEFETAESAQDVINRYNLPINAEIATRLYKGQRLSDAARSDFQNQAASLYNTTASKALEARDFYTDLADQQGLNPNNVTGSVGDIKLIDLNQNKQDKKEPQKGFSVGDVFDGVEKVGKGAFNFLLGNAKSTFQDVAQGMVADDTNRSNRSLLEQGVALAEQADNTSDFQEKERLLSQAQEIFSQVSQSSNQNYAGFSEDVNENPIKRGLKTGSEIAGTASLATSAINAARDPSKVVTKFKNTTKSVTDTLKKPFQKGEPKVTSEILKQGLKTADEGSSIRDKAIQKAVQDGKTVSGDDIVNTFEKWSKTAKDGSLTTSARNSIDDVVNNVKTQYSGRQLNPDEARNIWDQARKGFTSSGKAGNSAEAEVHRVLRDHLRGVLDDVAPGFEKGTKTIKSGLDQEKILKSIRTSLEKKEIKDALKADPSFADKLAKTLKSLGFGGAAAYGLYEATNGN